MPKSSNNQGSQPNMPDMSALLEGVLSGMPGMKDLPREEKKKMRKMIKATSEKVQQLDLESLIKDSFNLAQEGDDEPKKSKKSKKESILSEEMEEASFPPPPPDAVRQLSEIGSSVEQVVDTSEKKKRKKKKHKKKEELRTPDKLYQLDLSLEELYKGETTKKLTVRVDRRSKLSEEDISKYSADNDGDTPPEGAHKYVNTKIKHAINDYLEPGMIDEDVIIIRGQADEAEGYETGDIVASVVQDEHHLFERDGNDLWIVNKKISLAESYTGGYRFNHLDGRLIEIQPGAGEPLHVDGGLRRIPNAGMPIRNEEDEDGVVEEDGGGVEGSQEEQGSGKPEYGDLYIQFELEIPSQLSDDKIELLKKLCEDFKREENTDIDEPTQELIKNNPDQVKVHNVTVQKVDDPYDNIMEEDSDEDSDEEDSEEYSDEEESEEESEEGGFDLDEETTDDDVSEDETSEEDREDIANRVAAELIAEQEAEEAEEAEEARNNKSKKSKKNRKR